MFDILGDGRPIRLGWTAPGAENAFLALPDADGRISGGQQLFGNMTPQPPSRSPNGFLALGLYDRVENGGNGDGVIDARDRIFSSLRLWIDSNHNGVAEPEEIVTLPAGGVASIDLNYKEATRADEFGNVFRYRSKIRTTTGKNRSVDPSKTIYDVFFTVR